MAKLSTTDLNIIAKYPLAAALSPLRNLLRDADEAFSSAPDSGTFLAPSTPRLLNKAIDALLGALRTLDVSEKIKSDLGTLDVYQELQAITARISQSFNYEPFRPLVRLVIQQAPDPEIWTAVLNLIAAFSPLTSQRRAIRYSFTGTPVSRSSASFQGKEQTKKLLDVALVYELRGRIFRDVGGFYEKYFENREWTRTCEQVFKKLQPRLVDGRLTDFPDPPVQKLVWEWLDGFQREFLRGARGTYRTTGSTTDMTGGDAARQLDILIKPKGVAGSPHDWKDVLVVGEHKQSHQSPKGLLLQLSRYMRDVFANQPTRRFIHGFLLHGTTMEAWVFDRSGPYSSGQFDIHDNTEKFVRILAGYTLMSDEELGLDTFAMCRRAKLNVSVENDATGKKRRLQLDPEPFVRQRAVVCRGTTCFRTTDHENVVKFSWASDKRPPEAKHLKLATTRGVQGVARLVGYQRITSIDALRSALVFGRPWALRGTTPREWPSTSSHMSSVVQLLQLSESSSKKRKRSGSSNGDDSVIDGERAEAVSTKRSRTSYRSSQCQYQRVGSRSDESPSLYGKNTDAYDNRIFGCLAISPSGRALGDFQSVTELLTALRDAIKAHQSLYTTGRILHRDISENNIIITDPKRSGGFTGMLIDLDLAKPVGGGKTGARHQTGTMEFMAIDVLRKVAHTYRHDLESFFYVLIWVCGRRMWERGFRCDPKQRCVEGDLLQGWYRGSFDEIAMSKQGLMHEDGLDQLLDQFPPAVDGPVKHLCHRIREILFGPGRRLDMGTPANPDELYGRIIEEYDNALNKLS